MAIDGALDGVPSGVEDSSLKSRSESILGKTCFVIMPFGDKSPPSGGPPIDFDAIYRAFIKPAVVGLGLECTRSDEVSASGLIHRDMVDRILRSDVVIVDITTGNPNVMYELGVRHAAKRWGTIIVRKAGHERIPFNISGMRAVDYDLGDNDAHRIEQAREMLATSIINSLEGRQVDSLVHTLFSDLNVTRRAVPMLERKVFVWSTTKAPKIKLCIIWGDHRDIDIIDAWVNPENTKLQMGRFHDNSISSYIRYWGAERDRRGAVVHDAIAMSLWGKVNKAYSVEPGTVVVTRSGGLARKNGVKAIFHVAAQHGEPGRGYRTVGGYETCVANVLDEADAYNHSWSCRLGLRPRLTSIMFPLFGTRGGYEDPQVVATNLVRTAKNYVEMWPFSLERIYFQAYTDGDDELCVTAFSRLKLNFEGTEPGDS
jgi:O-acetyl-ADP-ribose deacetylase (regulator of RNase III)